MMELRKQILGNSKQLLEANRRLELVAPWSHASVLITGETGTGKELAARYVHEKSGRGGAFVAFNCATVPLDLMDSELFGHVRGAFSGANRDRPGLFEQAQDGTLFLDEIGDMPLAMQAKLLRSLQEGEIQRLGDIQGRKVDVRVVSATHHDLRAMIEVRQFRDDLLYRLEGFVVRLPPLRERDRDVLLLAQKLLKDFFPDKRLSREAEEMLLRYPWPGNIRELRNVVFQAGLEARRTILPRHLAEIDAVDLEGLGVCSYSGTRTFRVMV